MSRFAQHTRLIAAPGKRDELVAKFLESVEIQRDNADCELMLVSASPDSPHFVYLTEVWSSEDAWEQAHRRPARVRGRSPLPPPAGLAASWAAVTQMTLMRPPLLSAGVSSTW
jgi:quinol monooxygenase YgiN